MLLHYLITLYLNNNAMLIHFQMTNSLFSIIRSCQEINLTSLAKYPEEILGIAGKAHTWRYVTNRQTQRHSGEARRCKGYFFTAPTPDAVKLCAVENSSRDCGIAIFRVWIRTLWGFRYPGIGSLSEYEPILKIFAIYVKFSAVQSIKSIIFKKSLIYGCSESQNS